MASNKKVTNKLNTPQIIRMNTLDLIIKKKKKKKPIFLFPFKRKNEEAATSLRCRLRHHLSFPISPSAVLVACCFGALLKLVIVHDCGL
jgi:hypothetical protein